MGNMPISRHLVLLLLAFSVALLALQTTNSEACSPDPKYFKLSLEQRVSMADQVFIGRVIKVDKDTATFDVEESLVGSKGSRVVAPQGNGADCGFIFIEGARIFYAGKLSFGPTIQFRNILPPELAPIVTKLRQKIPLDPVPSGYFD